MRIFVVVHGYPPTAMAGTELCAARLTGALKARGHELFVMAREERRGWPEYKIVEDEVDGVPVVRVVNNFTRLQKRYLFDYHPRIEEIFEERLSLVRPDLVHVQHLAGASWRLPELTKARGIPLVVSLHDYWWACERVQMLRPDGTICPGPDGGRNCAVWCARRAVASLAAAVAERVRMAAGILRPFPGERFGIRCCAALQRILLRKRMKTLARVYRERGERLLGALDCAAAFVFPSEKTRSIYAGLGIDEDRCIVIPHGIPEAGSIAAGRGGCRRVREKPLAVGYAGNIMAHKGVETLLRAVKSLPPSRVRLKMYGRLYPRRYERFIERAVKRFRPGQVEIHGRYRPEELADIFAGLDVLVIPPLWNETFNLVLWEAWGARLPVIVSRVGAVADVVREGVDALTFSPGDWRGLRNALSRVADDPGILDGIRGNLPRRSVSMEENAERYEELFREVTRR